MKKIFIITLLLISLFSCNHPSQYICGVPVYGTPYDLMEELAFNENSEAFPLEYLLLKDKMYIYIVRIMMAIK